MPTVKKHYYLAKGESDTYPRLYFGEEPPIITTTGFSLSNGNKCRFVGIFNNGFISNSLKDNEIIKIYIRTETKKNK